MIKNVRIPRLSQGGVLYKELQFFIFEKYYLKKFFKNYKITLRCVNTFEISDFDRLKLYTADVYIDGDYFVIKTHENKHQKLIKDGTKYKLAYKDGSE